MLAALALRNVLRNRRRSVSLQSNLDLSLGVRFFGGSQGSEYARLQDLYYAQVQWFF